MCKRALSCGGALIAASLRCCKTEQCISRDRITGKSDVTNAHAPTACATSSNCATVQNVWPLSHRDRIRPPVVGFNGFECDSRGSSLCSSLLCHARFHFQTIPTIDLTMPTAEAQEKRGAVSTDDADNKRIAAVTPAEAVSSTLLRC
eukprot:5240296-Prymnesium_polylepis.1